MGVGLAIADGSVSAVENQREGSKAWSSCRGHEVYKEEPR